MKKYALLLAVILVFGMLAGCGAAGGTQVAATTLPVWQFTSTLCEGTPIEVTRLVTESISCLHDYTLTVAQMKNIETAEVVVISGAGLEDFMAESLDGAETVIDASADVELLPGGHHHTEAEPEGAHTHELDPHIWLDPRNAVSMASAICQGLCDRYPEHTDVFQSNLKGLSAQLTDLYTYGQEQLRDLSCRELITFHDGFGYLAHAFDLEILDAIEEESGSEASADELRSLIDLVREHRIPAIFTETNGSTSASSVISSETGAKVFNLDMAMAGDDYFESMYHNIDTLKEALGQ